MRGIFDFAAPVRDNLDASVGRFVANQTMDVMLVQLPPDPYPTSRTMMHLNGSFRKRFRKEHDALESDPMAPEPLRAKFRSDEAF